MLRSVKDKQMKQTWNETLFALHVAVIRKGEEALEKEQYKKYDKDGISLFDYFNKE